jgi:hypothetical protein
MPVAGCRALIGNNEAIKFLTSRNFSHPAYSSRNNCYIELLLDFLSVA